MSGSSVSATTFPLSKDDIRLAQSGIPWTQDEDFGLLA